MGGEAGVSKVFPPCDTSHLSNIVGDRDRKEVRILSLGQFRPEKDHPLHIKAMFELRQILAEDDWERVKLVIVGGCRGQDDWKLVQDLKDLTKYLSVENNVEFHPNLPFSDLLAEFSKSTIGIHTMWNEHFGIGIVEMMAAGLLTIAHRSGGPLMDSGGCRSQEWIPGSDTTRVCSTYCLYFNNVRGSKGRGQVQSCCFFRHVQLLTV